MSRPNTDHRSAKVVVKFDDGPHPWAGHEGEFYADVFRATGPPLILTLTSVQRDAVLVDAVLVALRHSRDNIREDVGLSPVEMDDLTRYIERVESDG